MRFFKGLISLSMMAASTLSVVASADEQQTFNNHIKAWKYPNAFWDNKDALSARLQLLDVAPKGSTVKILTFVFEGGDSTKALAAHVCSATRRGVKVQFIADSKSGSVPGKRNLFDKPLNEEIYQYMANCGAQVRIHNYLPKTTAKFAPALEYLKPNPQNAVNRLNHRKLFWVQSPSGNTCFILGGRNLGDHYLAWYQGEHSSFIDGDILYCNHHAAALTAAQSNSRLKGSNDKSNLTIRDSAASFDSLWNDKDETLGVKVELYDVQPNKDFKFDMLHLAKETVINGKKVVRDQSELDLVKLSSKNPKEKEGLVEVASPAPTSNNVVRLQFPLSYNWRVKTTTWKPEEDQVRKTLLDMIDKEQAEVFIESAYLEYDQAMQDKLMKALQRGVDVTVISNSMFVANAGSKLISLTRADWTRKAMKYALKNDDGNVEDLFERPRHEYMDKEGPGRFRFYVTTVYANHMIHFKGAGFKCQKQNDGSLNKSFLLGSHNFHNRSGLADKEHALVWDEPIDLMCVRKMGGEQKFRDVIDEIESRYLKAENGAAMNLKAEFRDLTESRLKFYTSLNSIYAKRYNKPILFGFDGFLKELEQELQPDRPDNAVEGINWTMNKFLGGSFKWLSKRVLFDKDAQEALEKGMDAEISTKGEKVINYLKPMRDWVANWL